jgi:hypothetical protein
MRRRRRNPLTVEGTVLYGAAIVALYLLYKAVNSSSSAGAMVASGNAGTPFADDTSVGYNQL